MHSISFPRVPVRYACTCASGTLYTIFAVTHTCEYSIIHTDMSQHRQICIYMHILLHTDQFKTMQSNTYIHIYIYMSSDTYKIQIHTYDTYLNSKLPASSRASATGMRWHAASFISVFMMLKPEVPGLRFVREPFRFTPLCLVSVT